MSFGYSVGDFLSLTQLAWRTVQNCRKACGEHDELTREAKCLHFVLQRVEQEASNPNSLFGATQNDQSTTEELKTAIAGCHRILQILDEILEKYNALSGSARTGRKLWSKVRFGNGEMADLNELRVKMSTYTSGIVVFLNLLSMGSQGRIEQQMDTQGAELRQMRQSLNWITASLSSRSEGSVLSAHEGDDKAVWKELRRELIEEGYSSSVITTHKTTIMEYIKELRARGILDEIVPPEEDPQYMDAEAILAENSSTAASSSSSNIPPEIVSEEAVNDYRTENHLETRAFASYESFSVRIGGWELPRSVCYVDGFVYFQVSTCYPCSVCESRIASLHAAIRENNRAQIENSASGRGDQIQRDASYGVIEGDRNAFFAFPYMESKTPQDIASYLSRRFRLDIAVRKGYRTTTRLPVARK